MDWEKIITFVTKKEVIIGLVALFLIIVVLLIVRKRRINHFRRSLSELEVKYNSIKSIPLSFKLNKAVALARVDAKLTDMINAYKDQFDTIHVNLKQITELLSEMEDNIITGKLKTVKLNEMDLHGMLERGLNDVNKLEQELDTILQQETQQRDEINKHKEKFREIKNTLNQKYNIYSFSIDKLNEVASNIENEFTNFEELMYASEFHKANQVVSDIALSLEVLQKLIDELPELLTLARGVIPQTIDKVSEAYSRCKQKGLYLQHLDVAKNIEVIAETLKQDMAQLRLGNIEGVANNLDEYQTRLKQLLSQIDREDRAYDEMNILKEQAFNLVEETNASLSQIRQIYLRVSARYGFDNIEERLDGYDKQLNELNKVKEKLLKLIKDYTIPASTILISLKEFDQEISALSIELTELKNSLDIVRSDEERAKKQLLKLHLIMNEIQVKIRKHRLPTISEEYEGDVRKAYEYIKTIEELLDEAPLNTILLSSTLTEAIDYIYLLYNNVNNLVGMAIMVENTIVFGNKFRSSFVDIDSELTRAELNFRNGEYTQALTIAMNAIEKLNLESYEEKIKENATSAS